MKNNQTWPADSIQRRNVADLTPYARNSRTHSDAQVAQIAASIKEWGWTIPVLIEPDGGIIAGHGRVMAAQRLGIDKVPCMVAQGWTEAQKRAYVVADNKLALNAGWDDDALRIEIAELQELDFATDLIGFDAGELDDLFKEPAAAQESSDRDPGEGVDAYPCGRGDVFRIGRHVIACGDSSDTGLIDRVLDGRAPDVVLYDPPFEVADAWGWLYPAPRAIVFCDYKTAGRAIAAGAGYEHCYQFVWDGVTSWYTPNRPLARHKSAFVFMRDPKWDFDAAIYHDGKEREAKTVSNTRGISDYVPLDGGMVHLQTVFQMGNTRIDDGGHAHAKPLEWVRALMLGCGVRNGAVVLDQFAGSGSFTISAPGGVSVRSIELDPETCGRAVTRIAAATGCQPERI